MSGSDPHLHPYRVEWQANRTTNWVPHRDSDSHDDARALAREHVKSYGGYCRVIAQHVIERVP